MNLPFTGSTFFGSGEGKDDFAWSEALASAPTVDAGVAPADLVTAGGPDCACASSNIHSLPPVNQHEYQSAISRLLYTGVAATLN